MTPPKPRRYNGPVGWLTDARRIAAGWSADTMGRVVETFPYPERQGVREEDWVLLVAHTAATRQEAPVAAAERLALYVTTYAERYREAPDPATLKETAP